MPVTHPSPTADHIAADRLRQQLTVPWRRRGIIVAVTVMGTVLAGLAVALATPRYAATALVMVAAPQSRVVEMDAVLAGAPSRCGHRFH